MGAEIGFSAQTPALPKGGGAVSGLGATFTPELHTGTGSCAIKLDCPNGPNDIGPRLSLRYDTVGGNGPFGSGWSLPLPRLVLSTAEGCPRYDGCDPLLLEGAGEILVDPTHKTYRLKVDGGAWRIEHWGDGFRLTDRDGLYYFLGTTPAARLDGLPPGGDPMRPHVFAWHLERIEDPLGHTVDFTWQRDGENAALCLSRVAYGPYEVAFTYADRPDLIRNGRAGFLVTTAWRCESIELRLPAHAQPLVRRWELGYAAAPGNGCSLLTSITLRGWDAKGTSLAAPPLTFTYAAFKPRELVRFTNADGTAPGPLGGGGRRTELVDWYGHGLPDLLEISASGQARLWPNLGDCAWGHPTSLGQLPWFATAAVALADMNGDGIADLVRLDRPLDGYLPRRPGGGFGRQVTWSRAPGIRPSAPDARLADLNGDGCVDLLTSSEFGLSLYYREGAGQWAERPQVVPRSVAPPFDLADRHVFVADMTGDGAGDLVRVDGGGVTCYPYLGLGRWAPPVEMDHPPELPFDVRPERLFLVDVDGDGCADLIYLDYGRVTYWLNQCGQRFGPPHTIDYLPTGAVDEVRVADMRGSGSPGLLWSTVLPSHGTTYFYLDFAGDARPRLLSAIDNGAGGVTEITYSTSAHEAAADARAGKPWATSLPVVVPVVSTVQHRDTIGGATSRTCYRYHDGRFDGILREFAGFGRVEQEDIGDTHQPTVRTVSWFHIGVDPADPQEEMAAEERQRLRSLRGRLYRQERYGIDHTVQEGKPYDTLEQQWEVHAEPTPAGCVYWPRLKRSVRSNFEREKVPAAVITTTNLAWDAHGSIIESSETGEAPGDPTEKRTLHTSIRYATSASGRFWGKAWRTVQSDDAGRIADTITSYDEDEGMPGGQVGQHGLVTRRATLVLMDAQVKAVYGASPPELDALGYYRRTGEDGWWIDQARYRRSEDAFGLHGEVIGPRGSVTRFDFDAARIYPVRVTDPAGNSLTAEYDYHACQAIRLTDASGATFHARFDPLARPLSATRPGDSAALPTVTYEHVVSSAHVEVATHTRAASGAAKTIDSRELYDGLGRVLERRVRDAQGEIVTECFAYGARGQMVRTYQEHRPSSTAHTAPDDQLPHLTFTYDALGRPLRVLNADGTYRLAHYGPLLVEEADEEDNRPGGAHAGTPLRRYLDPSGRVRRTAQNEDGHWVESTYAYDIKGRLIAHTDGLGRVVRAWYDCLGRTLRVDRSYNRTVSVYDAAGNLVEARDGAGDSVWREFDLCNRPLAVRCADPGAAPAVRFTYHDNGTAAPPDAGQGTAGGHCVRIDDESGTTIFDYDANGRVALKRSRPVGSSQTYDLNFEYRSDGQVARITYPDAGAGRRVVDYQYDRRGKLSRIPTVLEHVCYDLAGRRKAMRYGNDVEQRFDYDPLRPRLRGTELVDGAGQSLRSTTYEWDAVGNLLRVDSPDLALAATYGYDDLYRLTSAQTDAGLGHSYAYNDASDLTFKSDVGAYVYGENGAAPECLTTAGSGAYTYTSRGEMAGTPWGTLTYNPLGRLIRATAPDGSGALEFAYDYSGQRAAVRGSGAAPALDRLTPDPLYTIESGTLILNLFDGRAAVARQQGAAMLFLHTDHLGSLVLVTDTAGHEAGKVRYDPYGAVLERSGPAFAGDGIPMGFTGGAPDPWTDLLYLNARFYSPALGRFVTPDSLVQNVSDPFAWNPYAYCRDNPLVYVDPTGHGFWSVFLGIVGIAALVVACVLLNVGALVAVGVFLAAAAGGTISGIAAARKGGDFWDVLGGVLTGAAVSGWAALATTTGAGAAFSNWLGVGKYAFWHAVTSMAVNGAINGAATGFGVAYAGGRGSFGDTMKGMFAGALVGAVTGAILGGLSTQSMNPQNLIDNVAKPAENIANGPGNDPIGWFSRDVMGFVGNEIGAVKDWALSQVMPYITNAAVQPMVVDTVVGMYALDEGRGLLNEVGLALFLKEVGGPLISTILEPVANWLLGLPAGSSEPATG